MSGLLCLKWNNHSTAFYKTLNNHRSKELYCDATIVCRGKYYPVHRLVLTTCSEYFEEIFERTQCKHPFIIIKDIQPSELEALLNYMYKGEVNVLQDMLPGLIKAAESLKIRGLAVPDDGDSSDETKEKKRCLTSSPPPYVKKSRKIIKKANRPNDNRRSVSPSPCVEGEPEIISIEPLTSIDEDPSETIVPTSNNTKFTSNKSNSKQVSLLYDQDNSSSHFKQEKSSSSKPNSKENSEDLREDDDEDDNIELEDVKVEALELVPIEDMDENQYSLSETELDSKTETEGSLFRTLLGGDDTATSIKKMKNSINNEKHPMAQCSTWDDNLEHSNDDSHLNSDDMQDEINQIIEIPLESFAELEEQEAFYDSYATDKQHLCPYCSFESYDPVILRRHIKRHQIKRFSCRFCSYKTDKKGNMKTHIMIHTGERPYKCSFCDYKATHRRSVRFHIVKKHLKKASFSLPSSFSVPIESSVDIPISLGQNSVSGQSSFANSLSQLTNTLCHQSSLLGEASLFNASSLMRQSSSGQIAILDQSTLLHGSFLAK